jgi:HK97 family phage prohead protease
MVSDSGDVGNANIKACQSGIGNLNGAQGGTTIPDADVQGVYNHLAAHLRDADLEPPELKRSSSILAICRAIGGIERRYIPAGEIRVSDQGGKSIIEGHAAVFNQWSEDLGGFTERVLPGAFTGTIQTDDIRALFNHDSNLVLGRNRAGTLDLSEDKQGLAYRIKAPGTTYARDLLESIDRGDITQNSFGFSTLDDNWFTEPGDPQASNYGPLAFNNRRELKEVKLYDISPVTFPAYPQTDLSSRSLGGDEVNGIDFKLLANVIFRAQRGLQLYPADLDIINASIEALQSYLPPGGDGAKPPDDSSIVPAAIAGRNLLLARKRLELLTRGL